jgi:hypothetical protein
MPGRLRCDRINLNDQQAVIALLEALAKEASKRSNLHELQVQGRYYFGVSDGVAPASPGWYVICDENRRPLYVAEADNLDKRLNSRDGSRDNFANP